MEMAFGALQMLRAAAVAESKPRSLRVEVPKPSQDRPELGRVGAIAAAGFAIGVIWPWLAGVKLVPGPPTDEVSEAASAAAQPSASASAASARGSSEASPPAETAPERTRDETVNIGELQIYGCKDAKDRKLKDCDKVAFDALARGRLAALATCDAAKGGKDTLSIGFDLDFERKVITDIFSGKSSTFTKEKAMKLVECARKEFESVRLDDVDHEHEQYTVFYFIEFVPPGTVTRAPAAAGEEETSEASGLATVGWDVAVVRDEPETGKILTRLRFGTRVVVTARRGKWYRVKYDAKGTLGWVHRNALGL
jgi:hypothetical protein